MTPTETHQDNGTHGLTVECVSTASAERLFDAFIRLYDSERPDWVTSS